MARESQGLPQANDDQIQAAAIAAMTNIESSYEAAGKKGFRTQFKICFQEIQAQKRDSGELCAHPNCETAEGLRRCKGCFKLAYCGDAHQRAHWPEHKKVCAKLHLAFTAATKK